MVASNTDPGRRGRKKAAPVNRIGAVSPAARSRPKMTPVRMPGRAWGSTMRRMVCQRVAPNETLTVRKACGTARRASSAVLMMTGRVMMESVNEAARMLVPKFRNKTNSPNPNRPYTTDGMPARFMIAKRMSLVQELSAAYSDR